MAALSEDERISQLPQLRNGSGRIVTTSPAVGCIAFMLDEFHGIEDPASSVAAPPTFLPVPVWICGNSTPDPLEQCDDGDTQWQRGKGCRPNCTRVDCADPDDSGGTAAQDALFALQAAVGLAVCEVCVCDVDTSGGVTAVDALRILNFAVGLASDIQCIPCT